jgi:hypothetical protein
MNSPPRSWGSRTKPGTFSRGRGLRVYANSRLGIETDSRTGDGAHEREGETAGRGDHSIHCHAQTVGVPPPRRALPGLLVRIAAPNGAGVLHHAADSFTQPVERSTRCHAFPSRPLRESVSTQVHTSTYILGRAHASCRPQRAVCDERRRNGQRAAENVQRTTRERTT